jgi:hypothetical protein
VISDENSSQGVAFEQACKAFELFTLQEKRWTLIKFSRIRNASVDDRFFEAVHWVIRGYYKDLKAR